MWQCLPPPPNSWVLFWAARGSSPAEVLRYGLKGRRAPKGPFAGWYSSGGNLSWKASHPSPLPWLLAVAVVGTAQSLFQWCHLRHDSPGDYSGGARGLIHDSLGRGTYLVSWFKPDKINILLSAPESSLLWRRMHYIQFVSKRCFFNLFLQCLGGGDLSCILPQPFIVPAVGKGS